MKHKELNDFNPIKRVAAIHDLSGFGRSALSVVIPILSTMNIQVCSMPTAVLSTDTSGFKDYSFTDLTEYIPKHIEHWKDINASFNCIYSGFLGSPKQVSIISNFIDDFSNKDNFVVVDPVMGDDGKLYDSVDKKMIDEMKSYIKKANIITPNFTEAAMLLNKDFNMKVRISDIKTWLKELACKGPDIVVITSVPENDNKTTSVVAYNKRNDKYWKVSCDYIPVSFPGTGDIFTSVLVGSILNGNSLPLAIDKAVVFISKAIRVSYSFNYPSREGVLLEKVLNELNKTDDFTNYEMI